MQVEEAARAGTTGGLMGNLERSRSLVFDLAIVSALFLAFYFHGFMPGVLPTSGTDMPLFTQPLKTFAAEHLREGQIPLWNPYWLGGFPNLEQARVGFFYPATLLYLGLEFTTALKIDLLFHMFYAAVCAYFLGRSYRLIRPAAIGLAVLTFSGPFGLHVSVFGHLFALHVLAHLPLTFMLLRQALLRESNHSALGFALMVAVQAMAGDVQFLLYCLLLYGLYTAGWTGQYLLEHRPIRISKLVARNFIVGLAVATGLMIAAIQILPARELLSESIRGMPTDPEFAVDFSSSWEFYRQELMGENVHWLRFGTPFVAGALLPVLFVTAVATSASRRLWVEFALFGFFVTFSVMPAWFRDHVLLYMPIFYKARAHMRTAHLAIFLYHILICWGLDQLWREAGKSKRSRWLWTASMVVLIGYACVLLTNERLEKSLLAAEVATGVVALVLLALRQLRAVLPLCLLSLLMIEGHTYFRTQVGLWTGVPSDYDVDTDFRAFSRDRTDIDRVALFSSAFLSKDFPQSTGLRTRDRVLGGYEGLFLARTTRFLDASANLGLLELSPEGNFQGEDFQKYPTDWITEDSYDALNLLNVRYLISKGMTLALPDKESGPNGRFRKTTLGALTIYENLDAYPIAFTAHALETFATEREMYRALSEHKHDLRTTVLLLDADARNVHIDPSRGVDTVEVLEYGINAVRISASMSSQGFLVLTDVYYPGWEAYLDGDLPLNVYCVDAIVRGVVIPPGEHTVEFLYRPLQFVYGGIISAIGALIALLWFLSLACKRRVAGASVDEGLEGTPSH